MNTNFNLTELLDADNMDNVKVLNDFLNKNNMSALNFLGYNPLTEQHSLRMTLLKSTSKLELEYIKEFILLYIKHASITTYNKENYYKIKIMEESCSEFGSFSLMYINDEWIIRKMVRHSAYTLFSSTNLDTVLTEIQSKYNY